MNKAGTRERSLLYRVSMQNDEASRQFGQGASIAESGDAIKRAGGRVGVRLDQKATDLKDVACWKLAVTTTRPTRCRRMQSRRDRERMRWVCVRARKDTRQEKEEESRSALISNPNVTSSSCSRQSIIWSAYITLYPEVEDAERRSVDLDHPHLGRQMVSGVQ